MNVHRANHVERLRAPPLSRRGRDGLALRRSGLPSLPLVINRLDILNTGRVYMPTGGALWYTGLSRVATGRPRKRVIAVRVQPRR